MLASRRARARTRHFILSIFIVLAACGLITTRAAIAQTAASSDRYHEGVPAFGHVFLIIGENTTYDHLDATNAPFLMSTIKPNAAWLSQYYATTHWSQANYVA